MDELHRIAKFALRSGHGAHRRPMEEVLEIGPTAQAARVAEEMGA